MFTRSKAPRGAFTLIEILVVVGIISLLAAIMFPVFNKVRGNGQRTVCTSNLRQMGLAFAQYAQDYTGRFPGSGDYFTAPGTTGPCFASTCNGWVQGKGHWVSGAGKLADDPVAPDTTFKPTGASAKVEDGALFSYVKSPEMYYCPSDTYGAAKRLSYSMNCALTLITQSRVRTPQDIVLLVDEQGPNDGFFWAVQNPTISGSPTAGPRTDALTKRHNGGGNLLFVDGHVKFYSFDSFPLDETDKGMANKWKTSGTPRFHDRAFGPYGSNTPPGLGTGRYLTDFCDAKAGPGNADGTGNYTPATP